MRHVSPMLQEMKKTPQLFLTLSHRLLARQAGGRAPLGRVVGSWSKTTARWSTNISDASLTPRQPGAALLFRASCALLRQQTAHSCPALTLACAILACVHTLLVP